MPYRKSEREPFDPTKHTADNRGSFVRNTALENDKLAADKAHDANTKPSFWNRPIYPKVKMMDILHSEALMEYVKNLEIKTAHYNPIADPFGSDLICITGEFNGENIQLYKDGQFSKIDGKPIATNLAKKLFQKIYPLVKQRDTDFPAI